MRFEVKELHRRSKSTTSIEEHSLVSSMYEPGADEFVAGWLHLRRILEVDVPIEGTTGQTCNPVACTAHTV
jgi:hypothetical protein